MANFYTPKVKTFEPIWVLAARHNKKRKIVTVRTRSSKAKVYETTID